MIEGQARNAVAGNDAAGRLQNGRAEFMTLP
jgi:hypothetical protein